MTLFEWTDQKFPGVWDRDEYLFTLLMGLQQFNPDLPEELKRPHPMDLATYTSIKTHAKIARKRVKKYA